VRLTWHKVKFAFHWGTLPRLESAYRCLCFRRLARTRRRTTSSSSDGLVLVPASASAAFARTPARLMIPAGRRVSWKNSGGAVRFRRAATTKGGPCLAR